MDRRDAAASLPECINWFDEWRLDASDVDYDSSRWLLGPIQVQLGGGSRWRGAHDEFRRWQSPASPVVPVRSRGRIEQLRKSCLLYADDSLSLPETQATVRRLPLESESRKLGRLSASVTALAVLLEESGMFPTQAFETAVREFQDPSAAALTLRAIRATPKLAERE